MYNFRRIPLSYVLVAYASIPEAATPSTSFTVRARILNHSFVEDELVTDLPIVALTSKTDKTINSEPIFEIEYDIVFLSCLYFVCSVITGKFLGSFTS